MKEIEAEVVRIEVHIKDVQQKSSEINGKDDYKTGAIVATIKRATF